jgi:hypothetical protein
MNRIINRLIYQVLNWVLALARAKYNGRIVVFEDTEIFYHDGMEQQLKQFHSVLRCLKNTLPTIIISDMPHDDTLKITQAERASGASYVLPFKPLDAKRRSAVYQAIFHSKAPKD